MSLVGSLPISATNATIKFDGEVVGYLQNLRLKEDFNIKQVNELGNNIGIGFVAGAYQGEASAKKAFIETNLLLDILKPSINANMAASMGLQDFTSFLPNSGDREKANFVIDTARVVSDIVSTLKGDRVNKNNFILTFDIEVTTPRSPTTVTYENKSLQLSSKTGIDQLQEETIILLKKCIISSREITIDIGDLIVMNNLTIKFLNREV
jgi:hypothetical protein